VDRAEVANANVVLPPVPLSIFSRARSYVVALCIALTLLGPVATTLAASIGQFAVRHVDRAVEVDLPVKGSPPRWHLQNHGQELWLDFEHSRLTAQLQPPSVLNSFPLTRVSISDFGGGHVRLVIRVRGQVDYAVAQMPHQVVVRIAPSGQAVDLAQPLLAAMERNRESSTTATAPAQMAVHSRNAPGRTAINDVQSHLSAENGSPTSLPLGAGSGSSSSASAISANLSVDSSIDSPKEAVSIRQTPSRAVPPVTQELAADPGLGQFRVRPLVVIDAGHGGFDPGTESAGGITEKNLALAIAQRLAAGLEARGVDTELTRNDDQFLSLPQRTDFANHAHADLFVSIHLNSSPQWNTSGIETYYLNNTTDRATIRLARIENGGDYSAPSPSNLNYILANLRQDYKALESSSLARMIEVDAAARVDAATGITVHARGAKRGPFYVLVGAEMPSVLIECGFLSNPQETQLLLQPAYQQALADGIAMAIIHYFHADAAVGNL
jgi:N-acetylmuramoyl-L-alanine amidase